MSGVGQSRGVDGIYTRTLLAHWVFLPFFTRPWTLNGVLSLALIPVVHLIRRALFGPAPVSSPTTRSFSCSYLFPTLLHKATPV